MKSHQILTLILSFVIFINCTSDDDSTQRDADDGEIIAQVNGDVFLSSSTFSSASLQSDVLNINGISSNGDRISISINNFGSEGTYDLSGFTTEATAIYIPAGATTFYNTENQGGSGTVVISSYNQSQNTISGTFDYVAVRRSTSSSGDSTFENVTVANGAFSSLSVTNF